jgi:hypothetical protein
MVIAAMCLVAVDEMAEKHGAKKRDGELHVIAGYRKMSRGYPSQIITRSTLAKPRAVRSLRKAE